MEANGQNLNLQSSQQSFGIGMTHLFPIAQATYLIGCCIESFVRATIGFLKWLRLPKPPWPWISKHQAICLAFQAKHCHNHQTPLVRFDTDSIPIGINNHASCCMGNNAQLFEDLHPSQNKQVGGINAGLEIKGIGTFVFTIEDDNGKMHKICIPNSLHIPDLKLCLLSPQHWAQEAGDDYPMPNGTRMENTASHCILIWKQGSCRKSITFDLATNTPSSQLHLPVHIMLLFQLTLQWRPPSFGVSMFSKFQLLGHLIVLSCPWLRNLLQRKTFTSRMTCRSVRESWLTMTQFTWQTYLLPTMQPFDERPSLLILRHPLKNLMSTQLLLLMTKPSSCIGTIILATCRSMPSSSLPSGERSQRSLPPSDCHIMPDVYMVQ